MKYNLTEISVWMDESFSIINKDYVKNLKDHNINSVAIMVNKSNTRKSDKGWELRAKKEEFKRVADLFNDNEIDIILTCWPRPDKQQIIDMCHDMDELMTLTKAKIFEIDTESNYMKSFLKDFKTMEEAGSFLVSEMNKVCQKHGAKTSLSTYTYHTENSSKALVAPHMDELFPQAYSVKNRDTGIVSWNGSLGPQKMQKLTLNRAKATGFKGELCCGLAAYDQGFDGHTEIEAMQKALDTCVNEFNVKRIRFWSSKWMKNNYFKLFLKSLK